MKITEDIDLITHRNCSRFQQADIAGRYSSSYRADNPNDQREARAILRCMQHVAPGGHVLDFPCGSGRLLALLSESGFKVSGADSSEGMLERVRADERLNPVGVYQRDVFDSGFADNEFDAVICNRLFHHFVEPRDRKKAIVELARISKGPVILSFFNSFSLSIQYRMLRKRMQGKSSTDRLPVRFDVLKREIESSGMSISYDTAKRWGTSPLWYVVMVPAGD